MKELLMFKLCYILNLIIQLTLKYYWLLYKDFSIWELTIFVLLITYIIYNFLEKK